MLFVCVAAHWFCSNIYTLYIYRFVCVCISKRDIMRQWETQRENTNFSFFFSIIIINLDKFSWHIQRRSCTLIFYYYLLFKWLRLRLRLGCRYIYWYLWINEHTAHRAAQASGKRLHYNWWRTQTMWEKLFVNKTPNRTRHEKHIHRKRQRLKTLRCREQGEISCESNANIIHWWICVRTPPSHRMMCLGAVLHRIRLENSLNLISISFNLFWLKLKK